MVMDTQQETLAGRFEEMVIEGNFKKFKILS